MSKGQKESSLLALSSCPLAFTGDLHVIPRTAPAARRLRRAQSHDAHRRAAHQRRTSTPTLSTSSLQVATTRLSPLPAADLRGARCVWQAARVLAAALPGLLRARAPGRGTAVAARSAPRTRGGRVAGLARASRAAASSLTRSALLGLPNRSGRVRCVPAWHRVLLGLALEAAAGELLGLFGAHERDQAAADRVLQHPGLVGLRCRPAHQLVFGAEVARHRVGRMGAQVGVRMRVMRADSSIAGAE